MFEDLLQGAPDGQVSSQQDGIRRLHEWPVMISRPEVGLRLLWSDAAEGHLLLLGNGNERRGRLGIKLVVPKVSHG